MNRSEILKKIELLMELYMLGELGGETMPEDCNPRLDIVSAENYIFFTLPMSLNYQRDSYKLWHSACDTFNDTDTSDVFSPVCVSDMNTDDLRYMLTKHKLALQPNKQPVIWLTICNAIVDFFDGDIRNLFVQYDFSVDKIKRFLLNNKKSFPYLSGLKIMNYWLYVMQNYTDLSFRDNENITVAPDTHVIQASVKLGLISAEESEKSDVRIVTADRWNKLLSDTRYNPIDLHTPLWLWSRNKFKTPLQ